MYDFILPIMEKAAELMLSAHDIDAGVSEKSGDANFVTAYDLAVEDYLRRELGSRLPEAVFIGEEETDNRLELLNGSLALVIDPIDGTTNFIHNYRYSAISVGICDKWRTVFGAVLNPYARILYHAEKGSGAFARNTETGRDTPIHVSARPLRDALACFGTSPYYREELGEKTFRAAHDLFFLTRDVRRSGSAALDLCTVASGSLDVFFEYRLSPWDVAAGSLIVAEAGGVITRMDGSPVTFEAPGSILAGNPNAHREVLECGIF